MVIILAVFSTVMLVGAAQGAQNHIQSEDEETEAAASTIDIVEFVTTAATVRVEAAETTEETTESDYQSMIGSLDFGAEDAEILLKVAMAEAEGETVEGKALVMLVVLNRVWSDDFPDTIEDVVFQQNQFTTTKDGGRYWTTEPDEGCYEALELVLSGWDESQGAMYFESCKNSSWHSENLTLLFEYGNHRFYS